MKLGELRGAIRKTKGNPIITLAAPPGAIGSWKLAVQKTPLLEELERIYPGGKGVETDLEFNPDTCVLWCPKFDEATGMPLQGATIVSTNAPSDDEELSLDDDEIVLGDDDDDIDLGL